MSYNNVCMYYDHLIVGNHVCIFDRYDIVSPGEAQRISFARLFYHQPPFACECVCGMYMCIFNPYIHTLSALVLIRRIFVFTKQICCSLLFLTSCHVVLNQPYKIYIVVKKTD